VRRGVGVEKLARHEFAEIASRQEALQTIFPSLLDIFYHPIFDFFQKNRLFQQPQDFSTSIQISTVIDRGLLPSCRTPGSVSWLSIALAPTVGVLHGEASGGWPVLVHKRLGELEDKRVPGIQGNIHLASENEILLRVVLVDALDERNATE
jgi:hypothetical protein